MKTIFTVEVTYHPPGVIFEHSGNPLETVMRAVADAVANIEETGDVVNGRSSFHGFIFLIVVIA